MTESLSKLITAQDFLEDSAPSTYSKGSPSLTLHIDVFIPLNALSSHLMQKGKQSYRHVCQKITSRTFSLSLTHTHTHTTVLYTRAITKQRSERTTTCLSNENVHNSKRKGTSCRTKRNEAYRTEVGGVTGRRRRGKRRIHYLLQHSVCTTLSDQNALPACFFIEPRYIQIFN